MYWINEAPGRFIQLDGQPYRYFSGTSYLGMTHHEGFRQLLREGIERYGPNFGGSRLGNIRFTIFGQAERWLARWVGAEAAITVSSGTLAGQFLVKHLRENSDLYFAPMAHPALWDSGHYFKGDFESWISFIIGEAGKSTRPMTLLSNSVDALFARKFHFDWLDALPANRPITLVVDDSHGLGVCGKNGAGAWEELTVPKHVELVVVGSLGKALGVPGGVIMGRRQLLKEVWKNPFFGGASPISPAYLFAMVHAESLYDSAREKLVNNVLYFESLVEELGLFQSFVGYPVFYTPESGLAPWLEARHCLVSRFSYPTPEDEPVTRLVLSALHEKEDIDYLADAIRSFAKELRS